METLTEKILGKKIYNLTKQDLIDFFKDEKEETERLEFKSGEVELQKLNREITAFLNVDGGIIIVGSPKEKREDVSKNVFRTVCQGDLIPSKKIKNKNAIFHSIGNNIVPMPEGIKIQPILEAEGNYFVIEIPQSSNPPHQCNNDGKYYIRLDAEAKPAPHGIVKALFEKRQVPKLNVFFKLKKNNIETDEVSYDGRAIRMIERDVININISIYNETDYPAKNISGLILIYNVDNVFNEIGVYKPEKTGNNEYRVPLLTNENVLWKGLSINQIFDIDFKDENFAIKINVWSEEVKPYTLTVLYDPINEKIIEQENSDMENQKGLNYFLDLIEKNKKNTS